MSIPKRVGRRRWSALVKFLTTTMQTSKSERVRMQAAMRLSEVLMAREQKEIAELRAVTRRIEAAPVPPEPIEGTDGQQQAQNATVDVKAIWKQIETQVKKANGGNGATA
jgi:hypothetical protein